jgi:protein-L-isoaspartate(D-aspartate) O-methyltransferase
MTPHAQSLVRIERVGENEYRREKHGEVRFVPLVGAEGWPESEKRDHEARSGYGKL